MSDTIPTAGTTGRGLPVELGAPGLWVPSGKGKIRVLMPWGGSTRANPDWIKDELGSRVQVARGEGSSWTVGRSYVDRLAQAMVERYGRGRVTVVRDVSLQRKCGPSCQGGDPDRALYCECQCAGENHGGVAGWRLHGDFAIDTQHRRRVWLL